MTLNNEANIRKICHSGIYNEKKCTIQEDMSLTWTTVLRLTSVSLFGFLTYIQL